MLAKIRHMILRQQVLTRTDFLDTRYYITRIKNTARVAITRLWTVTGDHAVDKIYMKNNIFNCCHSNGAQFQTEMYYLCWLHLLDVKHH